MILLESLEGGLGSKKAFEGSLIHYNLKSICYDSSCLQIEKTASWVSYMFVFFSVTNRLVTIIEMFCKDVNFSIRGGFCVVEVACSNDELFFHDLSVLIEAAFEGVDLALGADPQLLANHLQKTFVVTY